MASQLVRRIKPWVIPATQWKSSGLTVPQISTELDSAVVVAKPSENLYLGKSVGNLDSVSSAIVNLASHGEMAIQSIHTSHTPLPSRAMALVDLLPTKVEFNGSKIGSKKGKLLNHFGYRKIVMNLVPNSLEDHAWIACALSYSSVPSSLPGIMFDPVGGGLAGGVAVETSEGAIFRGSAIDELVSAQESLQVSLMANGLSSDLTSFRIVECGIDNEFIKHRFFNLLTQMLNGTSNSNS
jgi:hypothetical protein